MKTRFLSILMVAMLSCVTFAGQSITSAFTRVETRDVEEDPIYDVLVSRSEVELTLTNDVTYPWIVEDGALKNGNCGVKNSTSNMTLIYKSIYTTELAFEWCSFNYSSHQPLKLYIDGVLQDVQPRSSFAEVCLYLKPGEHIIVFQDSIGKSSSTSNYSKVKNLSIKNILPLETGVLTEKSQPITFVNDSEWPWVIIGDGTIQSSNLYKANTISKFSTTFTISNRSKFSFERWVNDNSSYHTLLTLINGEIYTSDSYWISWLKSSILLEPGTYTIEWVDSTANSTSKLYSRIRNIELVSDWVDIDLATPGTLGVKVLDQVNVLTDVELLKVRGKINDDDWNKIKQMKNLVSLDLSEAKFDAIPEKVFDGHLCISDVKLPEGVISIGAYAFRKSPIRTINIPSTVQMIGEYAFYDCDYIKNVELPDALTSLGEHAFYDCEKLQKIHFSDNLKVIPSYCYYGCISLTELYLPADLTEIGNSAFYNTTNLRKVDFPEGLDEIGSSAFQYSGLDSVILPIKMNYMQNAAFANCNNLVYVELPAYQANDGYSRNFNNCPSLKTIVCKSATPPAIYRDPFENGPSKTNITLKVPAFAEASYKLDTYWYQFGTIEAMAETPTYWKIGNDMVLYNDKPIDVKPNVVLTFTAELASSLTVRGPETLSMNGFTMHWAHYNQYVYPNREKLYCSLINNSNMRSDIVYISMYTRNDQWTFFTVPFDVKVSDIRTYYEGATNWIIRKYDGEKRAIGETSETWNKMNGEDILKAGEGYIIQSSRYVGTNRQNYSGFYLKAINNSNKNNIFINTDATVQLKEYESEFAHNRSWNLIGNPYPCYYDTRYMDFSAPITVWNMNNNTYTAYSPMDDSYILLPGEAFFVQCPVEDKDILFSKEGRQIDRTVRAMEAKTRNKVAAQTVSRTIVNLSLFDGTNSDKTRIVLNNQATLQYEMDKDASKFMSDEATVPQLYTSNSGVNYAINERPFGSGVVDLCTRINVDGQYTLTLDNLSEDYKVELYDKKLNKRISLTDNQTYTFFAEAGEDANRFAVYFVNGATGISENLNLDESENETYSIDGVKVNDSVRKGVYIRNGKKVIVK